MAADGYPKANDIDIKMLIGHGAYLFTGVILDPAIAHAKAPSRQERQ